MSKLRHRLTVLLALAGVVAVVMAVRELLFKAHAAEAPTLGPPGYEGQDCGRPPPR